MAAATLTTGTLGRGNVIATPSLILVSVTGSATTYAAASGGFPIDLAPVLQAAAPPGFDAPNYIQALHPADIIGVLPVAPSTGGFLPNGITVGNPTYTALPWMSSTNASGSPGVLATCPAWIKLVGIGAAATNHAGFGEAADGSNSDVFSFWLVVARNGANS